MRTLSRLSLALVVFALMAANSAACAETQRVLIVHSFGRATPPFAAQSTAFQTTLTKEFGESVDINEVSLDIASYGQPDLEEPFVEFLLARLSTWQPDLVVPIGSPAGQFVVKYRNRFFPRSAIIYTAMDRRTLPADAFQNNATFVGDSFDLPGLFEDILQLAPDTNHIAIVVGTTPMERFWTQALRDAVEPFTNRVRVTWFNDGSFDETLRQIATLPPRSFIVFGLLIRDASGVTHNQDNILQRLHAAANAPISGIFQHQLGLGLIGGRLYSSEAAGAASACIAVRLLRGEPISKFPPRDLFALSPRYDGRELQRWNISEDRLPPGSVIEFREPTAWQRYRWQIVGAITVIGLQTVLLAGLHVQTGRRKRAEAALRDRLSFETLVSGLSATFAKLRGAEVGRGIEEGLRQVGEHLGVDRATITQSVRGGDAIEAVHVWRRPGAASPPLPTSHTDLPWSVARLGRGQLVRFSRLRDLPDDASVDRETFARMGITSGVALPLTTGGSTMGALTLSLLSREQEWSDDLVQRLEFVAEIFSSALLRGRTVVELEKLRHSLSHVSRVTTMAELTASLAHELRQPLTAILSNAQAARRMLDRGVEDTKELREILSDIVADDQRASELIEHVRAFIKKDDVHRGPVDVNAVVQDVVSLVRNDTLIRNISVEVDLDPGLPPVMIGRVQLQQVLVNLLMNAFDAVGSSPERRTTVTTRKDGTAIHVSVKDSGSGIRVGDIARIFNPFYTTKSSGLGMGLSIVRSLIEAHGGQVWAENNKDGGATFTFTVPVMQGHDG
jgi:signal transduction histidine kinase